MSNVSVLQVFYFQINDSCALGVRNKNYTIGAK